MRADFGVVEIRRPLDMGADSAYFPISGETVVTVEATENLSPVQPERDTTGIFQPGPTQFQGAGDGGVDESDLTCRGDLMCAELPADGHPLAVEGLRICPGLRCWVSVLAARRT